MPMWSGLNFQDSGSYLMEQLCFFHDHSLFVLIFVSLLVFYFILNLMYNKSYDLGVSEGHEIELVWTVLPVFMLLFIAFPSLKVLYLIDEEFGSLVCLKVLGHQWYWSYELYSMNTISFDSFLLSDNLFRMLDTDSHIYMPFMVPLRFLVTSSDVIHSWTLPALGVKVDALPGRLNQLVFSLSRSGIFFGQCSELCGANHSFMPITLESVSLSTYFKYLASFLLDVRFSS